VSGILIRTLLSAVTFLAFAAAAAAQESRGRTFGVVRGLAVDSLRGGVLRGARIEIEGTQRAAVTDSAGRFTIDSVPPGTHRLFLMHPLFDTL